MSAKRPPAPPPGIPGFRHLRLLGSGGFSDVYLYEQDRPRRKVAIKVLLADLKTAGARRRFETEANLMAQLSSHPYIVTIFEAQITDDGHSYLAMEYCSRPSLDVRYRRGKLGVDEALAVGIQVASAVETAHRAGIAHRDIKPANVLVTDYNRPALTDFGISGTTDGETDDDAGMSIPWSPPEAFHASNVDGVKVDIWALGATVYTLLAGRSPFVLPGMDNSQRELMTRIGTTPLPRLGRADVPDGLELALATAMSKSPDARYSSAHAFALALQRIQTELNMSLTPFEVLNDAEQTDPGYREEGEATRVRQVVSIDPESTTHAPTRQGSRGTGDRSENGQSARGAQQPAAWDKTPRPAARPDASAPGTGSGDSVPPGTGPPVSSAPGTAWPGGGSRQGEGFEREQDDATILRGQAPAAGSFSGSDPDMASAATMGRPAAAGPGEDTSDGEVVSSHSKRNLWLLISAGVVLVAAIVTGVVLTTTGDPVADPEPTGLASEPANAVEGFGTVPAPVDLQAKRADGSVTFTWKNPKPQSGDVFMWRPRTVQESGQYKQVDKPKVTVKAKQDAQTCIEVVIRRDTGKYSVEPATACAAQ